MMDVGYMVVPNDDWQKGYKDAMSEVKKVLEECKELADYFLKNPKNDKHKIELEAQMAAVLIIAGQLNIKLDGDK